MSFNEKLLAEAKELEKRWEIHSTAGPLDRYYQKPISLESERLLNEKRMIQEGVKRMSENRVRKSIEDLGVAAYLRMHGFIVVGRKGKIFYFDVLEDEDEAFNEAVFEYPNSPYHDFDSHLMALKKLPHYIRKESQHSG